MESSQQQMESADISADGTLILEGLMLLARAPQTTAAFPDCQSGRGHREKKT